MFCKSCGKMIDDDALYCEYCGSIIVREDQDISIEEYSDSLIDENIASVNQGLYHDSIEAEEERETIIREKAEKETENAIFEETEEEPDIDLTNMRFDGSFLEVMGLMEIEGSVFAEIKKEADHIDLNTLINMDTEKKNKPNGGFKAFVLVYLGIGIIEVLVSMLMNLFR